MRFALAVVLSCGLLACAPEAIQAGLSFEREAIDAGELWRLWTAHLVHFSAKHTLADLLVLGGVLVVAEHELGSWKTGTVMLAGAPLISLGLLATVPELALYRGSSGIAALMGVVGGVQLWRRVPVLRLILGLAGAAGVSRIFLDAGENLPGLSSLPAGVQVVWQAHLLGGLLAVVFGLILNRISPPK